MNDIIDEIKLIKEELINLSKKGAGVTGEIPNSYVETSTPQGTTSATLEDVTGMSTTITLTATTNIVAIASFQAQTQSGASASTIAVAISINGVDHDETQRYLSGSNDVGIGAIVHRTATALPAGTYTVKLRFRRVSGVSTPGLNRADMSVIALQGVKGADGANGTNGTNGTNGATGATGPAGTVDNASGLTLTEIATPSAPTSGKVKIYAKSDDKVYKQDSAGVETEIGAGGGGGSVLEVQVFS